MKLDHLGIAVESLNQALEFYEKLGLKCSHTEEIATDQVKVGFLGLENSVNIELLEATGPQSPIAKFIARRGPGIHHICLQVSNLALTLAALKAAGVRLIDQEPRPGAHGKLVAFVHPSSVGGVLLELTQAGVKSSP